MKIPIICSLILACVAACSAAVTPNQPFIFVEGTAVSSAKADIASLRFSLVERDDDVAAALERTKTKAAKVFDLIAAEQIGEKDVIAGKDQVEQLVDRDKSNTVTGVKVTRRFSVRIRNINRLADIHDRLIKIGAGEVQGAFFEYSKISELRSECEASALDNARKRADLLAKKIGSKVDRAYAVSTRPLGEVERDFVPSSSYTYLDEIVQRPAPPKGDLVIPEITVQQSVHVIYTLSP